MTIAFLWCQLRIPPSIVSPLDLPAEANSICTSSHRLTAMMRTPGVSPWSDANAYNMPKQLLVKALSSLSAGFQHLTFARMRTEGHC